VQWAEQRGWKDEADYARRKDVVKAGDSSWTAKRRLADLGKYVTARFHASRSFMQCNVSWNKNWTAPMLLLQCH
jgi:hypothetical protein